MIVDAREVSARSTLRRARRYLRWYPAPWRARYGEEFVAHLEDELNEHTFSISRGLNIALHGVVTRFRLKSRLRWWTGCGVFVASAAIVTVVLLGLGQRLPGVGIRSDMSSSDAIPTHANQINDVSFTFTSRLAKIRITKIAVVPLRGFRQPEVAGAYFSDRGTELLSMRGLPPRYPSNLPVSERPGPLRRVDSSLITLSHRDTLVVGFKTPKAHAVYVVSAIKVTYVHRGQSYTIRLGASGSADEFCVLAPRVSTNSIPRWCDEQDARAVAIGSMTSSLLRVSQPQRVAMAAVWGASIYEQSLHRAATLGDIRTWASRLFPRSSNDGVLDVTESNVHDPTGAHIHFVIKDDAREIGVCVTEGLFNERNDGVTGPSPRCTK